MTPGPASPSSTPSVHTWWATRTQLLKHGSGLLSAQEQARAAMSGRRADDFLAGAKLLRLAAAELTGDQPAALAVRRCCRRCGLPHGRPTLPDTGLTASVSHAGGLVAVALTWTHWVGLDLEPAGRSIPTSVAARVLSPHEAGLARTNSDVLRLWTAKEAVAKAAGTGLLDARLDQTMVASLDPLRAADLTRWGCPDARLHRLELPEGWVGTLATVGDSDVRQNGFPPGAADLAEHDSQQARCGV